MFNAVYFAWTLVQSVKYSIHVLQISIDIAMLFAVLYYRNAPTELANVSP